MSDTVSSGGDSTERYKSAGANRRNTLINTPSPSRPIIGRQRIPVRERSSSNSKVPQRRETPLEEQTAMRDLDVSLGLHERPASSLLGSSPQSLSEFGFWSPLSTAGGKQRQPRRSLMPQQTYVAISGPNRQNSGAGKRSSQDLSRISKDEDRLRAQHERIIRSFRQENDMLQDQINTLRRRNLQLREENDALLFQRSRAGLGNDLAQVKRLHRDLQGIHDILFEEHQRFREEYDILHEQKEGLQKQLDNLAPMSAIADALVDDPNVQMVTESPTLPVGKSAVTNEPSGVPGLPPPPLPGPSSIPKNNPEEPKDDRAVMITFIPKYKSSRAGKKGLDRLIYDKEETFQRTMQEFADFEHRQVEDLVFNSNGVITGTDVVAETMKLGDELIFVILRDESSAPPDQGRRPRRRNK